MKTRRRAGYGHLEQWQQPEEGAAEPWGVLTTSVSGPLTDQSLLGTAPGGGGEEPAGYFKDISSSPWSVMLPVVREP